MTYRIPLPSGGSRTDLDVIDPFSSMVQRFLRREGLHRYEPETAATLLTLFEAEGGPFALYDVGANIGLYSHLCAAMFAESEVHAFEPTPEIASICRSIAEANNLNVNVIEAAASDAPGTASLHLSETSDASNSLVAGFKRAHGSIEVDRITLDDYRQRSGVAPAILKIDVETHEPAVLAGAAAMIEADRPVVVVEVLRRRKSDQGGAIQSLFDGLGYFYYPLSATPDWVAQDSIRGSGTIERDWLLSPVELPADFGARWSTWQRRLAECSPDRNSRPPIGGAARAAYVRGGLGEMVSSARRFMTEDLVPSVRRRLGRGADSNR
ncbi:MAG: FkbM family methyltransferase [Ilumatobacter sp.]